MRWSQTLIPTQKETPADAQIISHQLMIRAGLIRQLTAGVYDFLPLGLRRCKRPPRSSAKRWTAAAQPKCCCPRITPIELWQKTGRDEKYGDNIFRVKDRHGRMDGPRPDA